MPRGGRNEAWAFTHRYEGEIAQLHAQGLRGMEIARRLGLPYPAVYYRMRQMGLRLRRCTPGNLSSAHTAEARQKAEETRILRGYRRPEGNSNWRGGVSTQAKYGFQFTKELKAAIRERYHHTCQRCGTTENRVKNGLGAMGIHHRNFDRMDNRPENLITLCSSCHRVVEKKRLEI